MQVTFLSHFKVWNIGEKRHQHFTVAFGGSQASLYDEMGKKYIRHSEDPYLSGTQRLLTHVSPGSNYKARDSNEWLTNRMRSNCPVGHDPKYGPLGTMSSP